VAGAVVAGAGGADARLVSRVRAMRSSPVSAVAFLDPVRIGAGATGAARGAGDACVEVSTRAREIRWSPVSAPAWFDDRGGLGPSTSVSPTLPVARATTEVPPPDLPLAVPGRWALPPAPDPPFSVGWTPRPSHSHQRNSCRSPLGLFRSPSSAGGRPGRRTRSSNRGRCLEGASGAPFSSASVARRCDKDKLPRRRVSDILGHRRRSATRPGPTIRAHPGALHRPLATGRDRRPCGASRAGAVGS
jgi:hypothetical protein